MTTPPLAPTELSVSAIRLLIQEMGIVNTAHFMSQFTLGYGNYTEERDQLFGHWTVDVIVTAIRQAAPATTPAKES
jgi:hypothetical protein